MSIPEIIPIQKGKQVIPKEPSLRKVLVLPLLFVIFLWLVEGLQQWFHFRLTEYGILPRTVRGIPGILTGPLVHAGIEHLLSNTMPLLVVGAGLLYFYGSIARQVILMVWLFTGFWVWLAARPDSHIGASGLIYGFVVFLFFSGLLRKDTRLMAISMLVTFLYGSMVWGILPVDQSISWESHFFGSVAGLFAAFYYRKEGPQRIKAQWEIEEELGIVSEEIQDSSESKIHGDAQNHAPLVIKYDFVEQEKKPEKKQDSEPL